MGAAILKLATTYLRRRVVPQAARGATIDAFALTLVAPLAATSCSPNPTWVWDITGGYTHHTVARIAVTNT